MGEIFPEAHIYRIGHKNRMIKKGLYELIKSKIFKCIIFILELKYFSAFETEQ